MSTQCNVEDQFIAELLIAKVERQLQEAADDFGGSFVSGDRPQIEGVIQHLQQAIGAKDAPAIAVAQSALNKLLSDLMQRATQRQQQEEAYWAETYWENPAGF